jgi:uncharacterized protein (TIGR03435 family)
VRNRSFRGKLTLVGIGGYLLLAIAIPSFVRAQSSASREAETSRLSFEVASVKPDVSRSSGVGLSGDAGRFSMSNVKVIGLITMAYDINDSQISGGPVWINSERFDIDGKVPDSLVGQMQKLSKSEQWNRKMLMLQALLEDRFKLVVTRSTKQLPIYRLIVAQGGQKPTEVSPPSASQDSATAPPPTAKLTPRPGGMFLLTDGKGHLTFTMKAATLDNLVGVLSQQLGRHVADETGLTGTYDADLQWTDSLAAQEPDATESNSGDISITTALQEQLGLRLLSTTGPVETIVIDHIEEPTPN